MLTRGLGHLIWFEFRSPEWLAYVTPFNSRILAPRTLILPTS